MKRATLVEAVRIYLVRVKNDSVRTCYPLDDVAFWRVVSGTFGDYGDRDTVPHGFVHGRFIDTVAYAVQQSRFTGAWMPFDPSNCNSGYVEKIRVTELRHLQFLDDLVKER